MKLKTHTLKIGRMAAFTVVGMGSLTFLHATPQMEPSGDSEVAEFIQMDVNADPAMKGSRIEIEVKDSVAILSGEARSLAQGDRATARSIACRGVKVVINRIEIKPVSVSEIGKNVKLALSGQKIIRTSDITATTNGDRVLLEGEVGTWDERDLARGIVSTVGGVTAIENRLTVNFEGERTDPQIQEQLKFLIKSDPLCVGLDLVANVKEGTVTLNGQVGSRGEFDRLVRRSYVTGVMEVNADRLKINSDLALEGLGDKGYTEEESLAALQLAMGHDSRVNEARIEASMGGGVMTLKGVAPAIAVSDAIETTARNIPGVMRVANEISIGQSQDVASNSANGEFSASAPVVKPAGR